MGDSAVHDGISIIHFAAVRRRENSSIAFGKAAVGNELLGNAFFHGLMPILRCNRGRQALRDITHTGSWKRGIPKSSSEEKALAMPPIASTANA
ncbi:TPA: hypothetical protein HA361_02310 [Candidatus Woesearchaeota archaeon]|nr:hypothetical protein [Candidatus Woesearchaeota archaeon]